MTQAASGAGFSLWGMVASRIVLAWSNFHRLKPVPLIAGKESK
jgi:hypothetical protein